MGEVLLFQFSQFLHCLTIKADLQCQCTDTVPTRQNAVQIEQVSCLPTFSAISTQCDPYKQDAAD